jgi:dTDP-glucose 4,6-dehydratase
MKYLITGGAGFIGSNFIHYLFEHYPDCEVTNLDKLTYAGNPENVKKFEKNPQYKFVKGDIADMQLVDQLTSSVDFIVNFAAETHVDRSITGPAEFIQTNVVGMQVLLDAAARHKKRFHHISTDEVFGDLPLGTGGKFTERSAYFPSSPYSASKAAADHLVHAYSRTYGLDATITNCSNNYGPYQNPEKLIPKTITHALLGKKIPVYAQGRNVRDWIHVKDHCKAIDTVLQAGRTGETYLVGGNCEKPNLEVVDMILKMLGKDDSLIELVPDRPGHDLRYAIDSSKIERELAFTRNYDFDKGLIETVEWYKQNQAWWQPLIEKQEPQTTV